jgi:hypothetical protein
MYGFGLDVTELAFATFFLHSMACGRIILALGVGINFI